MNIYTEMMLTALGSFLLSLLLIPCIKKFTIKVGLIDKPNARKLHVKPVPLAGGISIAITAIIVLIVQPQFVLLANDNIFLIAGSATMLILGALDDRFNIKPLYRLVAQLCCAFAIAASGVRINSFYGLLAIEISELWQFVLTMVVITGVVNAYNLMDGIDGLIGGLSLLCTMVLGVISFQFGQMELMILCIALAGSIIGFLRYNLSSKKLFMGDAGSLFLGFILVVVAIKLLNAVALKNSNGGLKVFLLIYGIFLVPVLDSLRVYWSRILRGVSPFKADKTHLHHLFIFIGLTHKSATFFIVVLSCIIIAIMAVLAYLIPVLWVVVVGTSVFLFVAKFLAVIHSVRDWQEITKKIEQM